jgi:hypothetical protein
LELRLRIAEPEASSNRQALLDSSANYVEGKLSFADAILAARRAGVDDAEIAHVTGLTVPMIAAVLRTP